jgi:hypothetical protein
MLSALLALVALPTAPLHLQETPPTGTEQATAERAVEDRERTSFQTGSFYKPNIHIPADVAIVYGISKDMPARVKSWRDAGYRVSLMTGVAWGEYQDYLYGRFDGKNHENEAQQEKSGYKISHGRDVYYMSPGPSYGQFLSQGVQRAIDAGVEAVYLEEPEFWVRGGYGDGFKQEWQTMYGTPWQDPQSSVDARWKANKLMYFLYRRALQQVFDHVQESNQRTGKHVRCYVATHSLLNYASWGIVSPESSLAKLKGCDGYIAQVWTGTARTPNIFRGKQAERTFDTAYLEYGAAMNMVRGTNKRMTFLADPIEDNPDHDWGDYRHNWEACVTASLLHPEVNHFEVMPWPERIFNGKYPSVDNRTKRVPVPPDYATELQVVIHALDQVKAQSWEENSFGIDPDRDQDAESPMGSSDEDLTSDLLGVQRTGVLVSDSLMFERGGPSESDNNLNHIYGLALPFVEAASPVYPVQLENLNQPHYLRNFGTLLLTYEGQKPLSAEPHQALAKWVKAGGRLLVFDDDSDPFNKVKDWWSDRFANPRQELFQELGAPLDFVGSMAVGKGSLVRIPVQPSQLARQSEGDLLVTDLARLASESMANPFQSPSLSTLRDELQPRVTKNPNSPRPQTIWGGLRRIFDASFRLMGKAGYVNLFDPHLAFHSPNDTIPATGLLQWIDAPDPHNRSMTATGNNSLPILLAAAGKVRHEMKRAHRYSFTLEGIEGTPSVLLFQLPAKPKSVTVAGVKHKFAWNAKVQLAWVKFPNRAIAQNITVTW